MDEQLKDVNWIELRQKLEHLLPLTLDQLSTFAVVCEKRSVRQAALAIGRDQSSVEKQLQTMDRNFQALIDERLVLKPTHRGGKLDLTRAGSSVRSFARNVLLAASEASTGLERLQKNYSVRIGLPTFILPRLIQVEKHISTKFSRAGLQLTRELRNLRSHELQLALLADRSLDFCLGPIFYRAGEPNPLSEGLDIVEWQSEKMLLLSNHKLRISQVTIDDLFSSRVPLLLPANGAIREFLTRLGCNPNDLNIVETCTELHFALDLLRLGSRDYCTICPEYVVNYAKALGGRHIYEYPFRRDQFRIVICLFKRKDEEKQLGSTHPIRMFWEGFCEIARKKCKKTMST